MIRDDVRQIRDEVQDAPRNLGVGLDDLEWYFTRYGREAPVADISQALADIRTQRAALMRNVWAIRKAIADAIKGDVGLR